MRISDTHPLVGFMSTLYLCLFHTSFDVEIILFCYFSLSWISNM